MDDRYSMLGHAVQRTDVLFYLSDLEASVLVETTGDEDHHITRSVEISEAVLKKKRQKSDGCQTSSAGKETKPLQRAVNSHALVVTKTVQPKRRKLKYHGTTCKARIFRETYTGVDLES